VTVNGRPFATGAVPFGATVDVTRGTLVSRTTTGSLKITAVFTVVRGPSLVALRLARGDFSVCPKRKTKGVSRPQATTVRQLWGNGAGAPHLARP
jgi:hypothetical protein